MESREILANGKAQIENTQEKGIRRIGAVGLGMFIISIFAYGENAVTWEKNNLKVLWLIQQGQYEKAERWGAVNVQLARKLFGKEHVNTAVSLSNYGDVYHKQEKYEKAIALYRESLAIAKKYFPKDARILPYQKKLALVLIKQKSNMEAEALLQRILALKLTLPGDDQLGIMEIREQLAALAAGNREWEKAKALYEQVLKEKRRLLGSRHVQVAETMSRLARIFLLTNDHVQAGLLLNEAQGIKHGASKNVGELQRNIALVQIVISGGHLGEQSLRQALASDEKEYGSVHRSVAADLFNLGILLSAEGKYGEACRLLQRTLDIDRKLLPSHDPQLIEDLIAHGRARLALREYQVADDLFQEAFAKLKETGDAPGRALARINNELGILSYRRFAQATQGDKVHLQQAEQYFMQAVINNELGILSYWRFAQATQGDKVHLQQAEQYFMQAVQYFLKDEYKGNLSELNLSLIYLGLVYEAGPDLPRQLEKLYEQVVTVQEKNLGEKNSELVPLFLDLAKIYGELKRFTEAELQLEKAQTIIARDSGENSPYCLQVYCQQADLLVQVQKKEKALVLYEKIASKLEDLPLKDYAYLWLELGQVCNFFLNEQQFERALKVNSLIENYQLSEFPFDLSGLLSIKKQSANLYKLMHRKAEAKLLAKEIYMLQQRLNENGKRNSP